MFSVYTVCFFGHRQIDDFKTVEQKVEALVYKLLNEHEYVEVCEQSAKAHPKSAIQIRNRAMVDRSDLCVFYVTHKSGGAYQTLRYTEKTGANNMNLLDLCYHI